MDIMKILVDEFKIKEKYINNVVELLDEGNTIPFIARYRKELTGEMEDKTIRDLSNRLNYLRNLEGRKEEVIRLIDEQGKLTVELEADIIKSTSLQRVEDLYRPYKQKRRTRATIAKEKGLDGLANIILEQKLDYDSFMAELEGFIDEEKDVNTSEEALAGAMDIIAEIISDDAEYRRILKDRIYKEGILEVEAVDKEESTVYDMYYEYREPIKSIANHRVLAINRGERDKKLKPSISIDEEALTELIEKEVITNQDSATSSYVESAIKDGFKRLLFPSIVREIRSNLSERAEEEAINIFALNLEPLLMQPPIKGKTVMAIDPGFRTGCKVAIVDETGKFIDNTVVYPTEPQNKVKKTKKELKALIDKYEVDIIAIGNGTASRETEQVVADIIREMDKDDLSYIIVSEAGASIYSASEVGIYEFPDLDVTVRGAISIARRLQDPLAELVKIDPKHIGVGQYQHDLNQGKLNDALSGVVEDSVNKVGVDLNTASPSLLKYIAGVSTKVAGNIVSAREEKGKFNNRKELLKVKGLGPKTYEQCAGFLRIAEGENPLDNTGVHPESYNIASKIIDEDYRNIDIDELTKRLEVGKPTLVDIIVELEKPGRDPRDEMPKPILRQDVLGMDDLNVDMVLSGTVRNVVDFGAFVDIGVKEDGLVHISQLSNKFVKHPSDIVKVGDIVKVKIIDIDKTRGRISLSMKGF
ncbi:MAG TPA: Tex family protein [Tissierellaceae bacterium]|nr:Tex family protein [Tissierellaceae bacterium]